MLQLSLSPGIGFRSGGGVRVGEAWVQIDGNDVLEGSSDDFEGVFPLALRRGGGGGLRFRPFEHLEAGWRVREGQITKTYR